MSASRKARHQMKKNEPNYTLDDKMISLVAEITEIPTHLEMRESAIDPLLRKKNRLKTIHSSLAIEQNTRCLWGLTTLQETLRDALVAVKKSVGKGVVKVDSAESEAVRVADGQVVK